MRSAFEIARFFSETGAGKHVPRCVMVDLEPTDPSLCLEPFFFCLVFACLVDPFGMNQVCFRFSYVGSCWHVCLNWPRLWPTRMGVWHSAFCHYTSVDPRDTLQSTLCSGGGWSSHRHLPPAVPPRAIDFRKRGQLDKQEKVTGKYLLTKGFGKTCSSFTEWVQGQFSCCHGSNQSHQDSVRTQPTTLHEDCSFDWPDRPGSRLFYLTCSRQDITPLARRLLTWCWTESESWPTIAQDS